MDREFQTKVKETLVNAGLRHSKNHVVGIRHTGNGIDTTRRSAWYRYEVEWKKPPTPALLACLAHLPPMRPGMQAYASDIDRIDLLIESVRAPNDA